MLKSATLFKNFFLVVDLQTSSGFRLDQRQSNSIIDEDLEMELLQTFEKK